MPLPKLPTDNLTILHFTVVNYTQQQGKQRMARSYGPAKSGQQGGLFYWVICVSRFALSVTDFFLDILFGHTLQHGSRVERKKSEEYENSAQVVNIVARGTYSVLLIHQLHHFVWYHEKYVHPRYVLQHDNITLMGVTPTHVFFCVSDRKFDVLDIKASYETVV